MAALLSLFRAYLAEDAAGGAANIKSAAEAAFAAKLSISAAKRTSSVMLTALNLRELLR